MKFQNLHVYPVQLYHIFCKNKTTIVIQLWTDKIIKIHKYTLVNQTIEKTNIKNI